MEKTKIILGIIIGIIVGILIISLVLIFIFKIVPETKIKEIEVCEGVTIATVNANSDLCYFGCIQYKGEFVPYNTLKYLENVCAELNSEVRNSSHV